LLTEPAIAHLHWSLRHPTPNAPQPRRGLALVHANMGRSHAMHTCSLFVLALPARCRKAISRVCRPYSAPLRGGLRS